MTDMNNNDKDRIYRIGTRGSPLALAQAYEARDRMLAADCGLTEDQVEIVPFTTKGDRILDRALGEIGGKGLFTEEIEQALYEGRIDMAAHSMKDMPTELPEGLEISCLLPREDVRDVFLSRDGKGLMDLPPGSLVGTASLRRQAIVLHRRPDLKVATFRGNIQTRMKKLQDGEADATLLAAAGLNRMDMLHAATEILAPDVMLPAIAQGAIGLETRSDDDELNARLAKINCIDTTDRVTAERAFLASLDGSCRTPIAGLATLEGDDLNLKGWVLSPDGKKFFDGAIQGKRSEAARLGAALGEEIKKKLPDNLFG